MSISISNVIHCHRVRDNNFYFNKLHFRAEMRHYLYDWQILGQPAPQPESPWSRLPDAVLRRMACVVPFVRRLSAQNTSYAAYEP